MTARARFPGDTSRFAVTITRDREVVGTYRILPAESANAMGGYYTEREFDLARLDARFSRHSRGRAA